METPQKSKSSIFARNLLIVAVCSLIYGYVCHHIRVPPTHSLSKRVFWSVEADRSSAIKTGLYVIFNQFVPKPYSREITFIKRAGCTSGDTLKVESDYYYCNGHYLGHAKRKSLAGEPIAPFVFNGVVPDKMIFAIGDHPDSYDSRYVGFVSRDRIRGVAWALF